MFSCNYRAEVDLNVGFVCECSAIGRQILLAARHVTCACSPHATTTAAATTAPYWCCVSKGSARPTGVACAALAVATRNPRMSQKLMEQGPAVGLKRQGACTCMCVHVCVRERERERDWRARAPIGRRICSMVLHHCTTRSDASCRLALDSRRRLLSGSSLPLLFSMQRQSGTTGTLTKRRIHPTTCVKGKPCQSVGCTPRRA